MLSVDQNCHSLWDVIPKVHALLGRGESVRHCIEDVDVAFTSLGAPVDSTLLRFERERFYRSGGQDWGAALFYSEFLGRVPIEVRDLEAMTGMSTRAMASRLRRSVDDIYDELSPSDNWQLVGSSYVGDKDHHRLIGDLTVAETEPFLRKILQIARDDMLRRFPGADARRRVEQWMDAETRRLDGMLRRCADGTLVDLYEDWLGQWIDDPNAGIARSGDLLGVGADADRTALLELFTRDYARTAGLYNAAIADSGIDLHPLDVDAGELPFFAAMRCDGRLVRTEVFLDGDTIRAGEHEFRLESDGRLPLDALRDAGIFALAGKAILLVLQVRCGANGRPLALPYRGSLYMPAAQHLERKLANAGLLPAAVEPLVRVRFHLLDRMRDLDTPVALPDHLADALGRDVVPARVIGESWAELQAQARARLEQFRDAEARSAWQRREYPQKTRRIEELDVRRRRLAETDPKGEDIRRLSKEHKALEIDLLDRTVRRIHHDVQLSEIDYWDSRGALIPWAVALGGEDFYNRLVTEAEVYAEPPIEPAE